MMLMLMAWCLAIGLAGGYLLGECAGRERGRADGDRPREDPGASFTDAQIDEAARYAADPEYRREWARRRAKERRRRIDEGEAKAPADQVQ